MAIIVIRGRSGEFHGSPFWFLCNDDLDANGWSLNRAGNDRPEFKQNQFGGNSNGPIWKGKRVYCMFGYEGTRVPGAQSLTVTVPTALERRGGFFQGF